MNFYFFDKAFEDKGRMDATIKCPKGHNLFKTSLAELKRLPGSAYTLGGYCDQCRTQMNNNEPVYHCQICNYDLCLTCKQNHEFKQAPPRVQESAPPRVQESAPPRVQESAPPLVQDAGNEKSMCITCCSDHISSAFLPCGHACMCYKCSQEWISCQNVCPICRTQVQSIIRLYIAGA